MPAQAVPRAEASRRALKVLTEFADMRPVEDLVPSRGPNQRGRFIGLSVGISLVFAFASGVAFQASQGANGPRTLVEQAGHSESTTIPATSQPPQQVGSPFDTTSSKRMSDLANRLGSTSIYPVPALADWLGIRTPPSVSTPPSSSLFGDSIPDYGLPDVDLPDYTDPYPLGGYNDAGCPRDQWVNGYHRGGSYVEGYFRNSPTDGCGGG